MKASFFVTGRWAEQYPEMVTLISEKGHDICNYSNTHPRMTQLSREEQKEEILNCSETLRKITGFSPLVFRAPYGDCDPSVVETVNDLGMYCLQWNIDSLDWQNADPESMKNQVLSQLQPGSVILFHNGSDGTPQALPATIAAIQEAGYELKPVSQLLLPSPYLVDYDGKQIPKNT